MPELLGLADRELADLACDKIFGHGPVDGGRCHQVLAWDMEIPVIFHHPSIFNLRMPLPIELLQVLRLESLGQFQRPVASEIEEDHAIAIEDFPDWFFMFRDNEGGNILVDGPGLLAQGDDRLMG